MQNPSAIRTRHRAAAAPTRALPWTFMLLVVVCACVVAAGFFFAARQHFTSMDYGLKNSRLRDQLHNLETEKRRLMFAREVALSPVAIRKAARNLGMREGSPVVAVATSSTPVEKSAAAVVKTRATDASAASAAAPAVVRTSMSRPVQSKTAQPKTTGESRPRIVAETSRKSEVAVLLKFR